MEGEKINNNNSRMLDYFSIKPVVYNPIFAEVSGDVSAGVFMSQLLYWSGKGSVQNVVYKTIEEFQEETKLNRYQQDKAIEIWKNLGCLCTKVKGIPAKRYFHIHVGMLQAMVAEKMGETEVGATCSECKSVLYTDGKRYAHKKGCVSGKFRAKYGHCDTF